jgi:hypothetical protein
MPVDASILAMMHDTFVWKQKTGQDAWQNATLSSGTSIRGIHNGDEHEVADDNGVKQIAQGTCYLEDVFPIGPEDELWWNGERLGKVIRVESWPDPRTGAPYGMVVHHG